MGWDEVEHAYDLEMELTGRLEQAENADDEYRTIEDELLEDDVGL